MLLRSAARDPPPPAPVVAIALVVPAIPLSVEPSKKPAKILPPEMKDEIAGHVESRSNLLKLALTGKDWHQVVFGMPGQLPGHIWLRHMQADFTEAAFWVGFNARPIAAGRVRSFELLDVKFHRRSKYEPYGHPFFIALAAPAGPLTMTASDLLEAIETAMKSMYRLTALTFTSHRKDEPHLEWLKPSTVPANLTSLSLHFSTYLTYAGEKQIWSTVSPVALHHPPYSSDLTDTPVVHIVHVDRGPLSSALLPFVVRHK